LGKAWSYRGGATCLGGRKPGPETRDCARNRGSKGALVQKTQKQGGGGTLKKKKERITTDGRIYYLEEKQEKEGVENIG